MIFMKNNFRSLLVVSLFGMALRATNGSTPEGREIKDIVVESSPVCADVAEQAPLACSEKFTEVFGRYTDFTTRSPVSFEEFIDSCINEIECLDQKDKNLLKSTMMQMSPLELIELLRTDKRFPCFIIEKIQTFGEIRFKEVSTAKLAIEWLFGHISIANYKYKYKHLKDCSLYRILSIIHDYLIWDKIYFVQLIGPKAFQEAISFFKKYMDKNEVKRMFFAQLQFLNALSGLRKQLPAALNPPGEDPSNEEIKKMVERLKKIM